MKISFTLNGAPTELEVAPLTRLLDVIRLHCSLTATKEGCGEGECGSCTVLIDGEAVNSCLIPAIQVEGRHLETLESVASESGALSRLQSCLLDHDGAQCGICTPGMVMAGTAWIRGLKKAGAAPSEDGARHAIAGNLCRCTGYKKIIEALVDAAQSSEGASGA